MTSDNLPAEKGCIHFTRGGTQLAVANFACCVWCENDRMRNHIAELERSLSLANDANGTIEAALLDARRENAEQRKLIEARNDQIDVYQDQVRMYEDRLSHEPKEQRVAEAERIMRRAMPWIFTHALAANSEKGRSIGASMADWIAGESLETGDLVQNRFSTRTLGGCPNCSQPIGSPHLSGCESKPSNTGDQQ